ncbi:MAG: hypothetical protein PVJ55_00605 [Anaerolineae bacterium]|jgi:hypothetical protein
MLPKNWPRWVIIPIGFALAIASIGVGLILEPAVQSLALHAEPTPTLPCLEYAAPLSGDCVDCHTDLQRLQQFALGENGDQHVLIETAHVNSVHGQLGCVTCHGGTSGTDAVDAAHVGLIPDPTTRYQQTCLLCHRDLRDPRSEDTLHRPHGAVLDSPQVVRCSACHGAVGHGFATSTGQRVCSMSACLDCHEAQNLDVQSQNCGSCHIGPHDVATALSCSDCHTSIEMWHETRLSVHPIALTGGHADAACFQCHNWPNFGSLDYVCTDCHERPHDFGGDQCTDCHTPAGWGVGTMEGHAFPTDHGGAGGKCATCHLGGDTSTYYCFTCHSSASTVDAHRAKDVTDTFGKCTDCHTEE